MPSDTIVDNRLSVHLDLGSSPDINARFLADPSNRAHLANQALLYDRIAIPTKDYGIVPTLISWLGLKPFWKALNSNSFYFLHKPSFLGYAGNGNGIAAFTIKPSPERPFLWWQEAIFTDTPKAVELQLKYMCSSFSQGERSKLVSAIVNHSSDVDLSGDIFDRKIVAETYADILNSEELRTFISALGGNRPIIDLKRIPGIDPNQLKVSNYGLIQDPTDIVLRVAEFNLAAVMATQLGNCDLYAPTGADLLLASKLARSGINTSTLEKFINLLDLNNVPDPGVAVAAGNITLDEIWKLRESSASVKFRAWLKAAQPENARELEKMYVTSLGQKGFHEALPGKVIRFAITTAAGMLNPIVGTGIGMVDSFFVVRWLQGSTPQLFLDQLSNIYPENRTKKIGQRHRH
jgi:hypothetical protein